MVPLRRRGERSLKPSRFLLAGEKPACFLNPKAGAYGFLNTQSDLFWGSTLSLSITEMEMFSRINSELDMKLQVGLPAASLMI
jgi:hypothetical protein